MAAVLEEPVRFQLPARLRKPSAAEDSLPRLALADRISALPGIRTVENGSGTLPCGVTVYLTRQGRALRKQLPPRILCEISKDGVSIYGLCNRDRHQVLSRGWGKLEQDRVRMFLPRDDAEMEVCWRILQRAYCSILDLSARSPSMRYPTFGELPRFSRTTLQ